MMNERRRPCTRSQTTLMNVKVTDVYKKRKNDDVRSTSVRSSERLRKKMSVDSGPRPNVFMRTSVSRKSVRCELLPETVVSENTIKSDGDNSDDVNDSMVVKRSRSSNVDETEVVLKRPRRRSVSPVSSTGGHSLTSNNNSQSCVWRRTPNQWTKLANEVMKTMDLSFDPTRLQCRDSELDQVRSFIHERVCCQQGDSLYLCGSPGTGKSLTVSTAISQMTGNGRGCTVVAGGTCGVSTTSMHVDHVPVKVVSLNAMQLHDHRMFYNVVLSAVDGNGGGYDDLTPHQAANKLKKLVFSKAGRGSKRMILLVVDEIDSLLSKAQTILYQLFEWPKKKGCRLILIGIANAMDLTHRFLPRLRARKCEPSLIVYNAYTSDQLTEILVQRVKCVVDCERVCGCDECQCDPHEEDSSLVFFEQSALELCSRKVASRSGDIRKCLDFCRQALTCIIDELDTDDDELRTSMPKVSVVDMARKVNSVMGSPSIEMIRSLPRQQKIMLCVAAIVFRKGSKDALMREFRDCYRRLANKMNLPIVSSSEFVDIFTALHTVGLTSVKQQHREPSKQRVVLNVQHDDIVYAMESSSSAADQTFFCRLLELGELRCYESCKL